MVTAAELAACKDGKRVTLAGIVLVRQRPGSAKRRHVHHHRGRNRPRQPGGLARRVRTAAPPDPVRRHDRVRGRLQREGEVMHVVADRLTDLSDMLRSVAARDEFRLPTGRGDEARHGGGPDSREAGIRVRTRDFR